MWRYYVKSLYLTFIYYMALKLIPSFYVLCKVFEIYRHKHQVKNCFS